MKRLSRACLFLAPGKAPCFNCSFMCRCNCSCMEPTPQGAAITQLASRSAAAQTQAQEGTPAGSSAWVNDDLPSDGAPAKKRRTLPQKQLLAGPTLNLLSSIRRNPVLRGITQSEGAAGSSANIQSCVNGVQSVLATCSSRGLDRPGAHAVDAFLGLLPAPVDLSAGEGKSWQPSAAQCLRSITALESAPARLAAWYSAASCGLVERPFPQSTAGSSVLATVLGQEGEAEGVLDADVLRARWEEVWGEAGHKVALAEPAQWLQEVAELSQEPHRVREAKSLIKESLQVYQDTAAAQAQSERAHALPTDSARAEEKAIPHVQSQLQAQWGNRRSSLERLSTTNGPGVTAVGQGRGERSLAWRAGSITVNTHEDSGSGTGKDRERGRHSGGGNREAGRHESAGVVQLMDDAVKSLEAAMESAQGSDVGSGTWEKVHERVQEAESLVKKLKSMCRRHSMQ